MALKVALTKAEFEKLSEELKKEYVADGDNYKLDADYEDVKGLKSTLEKLKADKKELSDKLIAEVDKFKDIDPERAREALKTLHDLDEKKLTAKGDYDRLLKKRNDEFDVREAESQKTIAEQSKRLDTYELINPLRDALLKAGVMADRIDDALLSGQRFVKLDDKRKVIVLDKDGDPSGKTLEEFAGGEFKESKPWLYAASGTGGSGSNGSNGKVAGAKEIKREAFEALSQSERMAKSKEGVTVID